MKEVETKPYQSPDTYLLLEESASEKHEYRKGEITALAGASLNHARIVRNVSSLLHNANSGCEVFMNDVKLQVKHVQDEAFYYPDLMVICGDVQVSDTHKDIVLNPILIIEVLSASTEKRDRGVKFQDYQKIDSLKEYVLISQGEYSVEVFSREQQDEAWIYRRYSENSLTLRSLNLDLSLADIYQDIDLVNE